MTDEHTTVVITCPERVPAPTVAAVAVHGLASADVAVTTIGSGPACLSFGPVDLYATGGLDDIAGWVDAIREALLELGYEYDWPPA